ncbi:nitroreductase family protein [Mesorhizobium sp. 1M-11]|uniref:nitroreductase family protein n=1 Tax=Mesorhizobium sp. 1M-11 TaxID=1529006 RepID=UPI0006C76604|nr:nitroreductase family protein [Mesorhizobium sp. 1M-11]
MPHPAIELIERRTSVNRFDNSHTLADGQIADLIRLATRAPTAFNLQNWRFIAVRTPEAKARLRKLAYGQVKVSDAAVTFIVCGQSPDYTTVPERLRAIVESGHMAAEIAIGWQEAARRKYLGDPGAARDEAIRSASLGAATLIYAAEAFELASGAMGGFDPEAVALEFNLRPDEIPVLLLPVGRIAPGNWPQKARRPITEVLELI